ncbi:NADP-dependent oxidoreductase [Sphingomonas profundi]|uniref:NADP-dependent oxidoreductase n=1 Tax=Alterirhizorhabdus profundi TaxID=2681549 RepID=UPI0012E99212|nr:NADP-dependent oxidoreductase [Sphingomonas profundi]
MTHNRRFTLVRRPQGTPVAEDFALVSEPLPDLAEGEVLVRNAYASLDPAIRGWLDDAPSYLPPVRLGDPVRATTIGRAVRSRDPAIAEGQWMLGLNAIEEYSVARPGGFTAPVDASAAPSVTNFLSVFGAVGMTAYFGLIEVGRPQAGETVLVSGAAGAVGSLVGQIAKRLGCRTVGIAGGPDKCRRLIEDYGYDAAIDYRGRSVEALAAEIGKAAPDGVDVIFENVGGDILDAGLLHINRFARIALCGLIAEYNSVTGPVGARNLWQLIVKTARIEGLLVSNYIPRFPEGAAAMGKWLAEGGLRVDEHIDEGIENALPAFLRLFEGSNEGKMILKLD